MFNDLAVRRRGELMVADGEDTSEQALAEFLDGRVGHAAFALVTEVVTKLARTGRFRTPSGSRQWSAHDIEDLVGDFFHPETRAIALAVGSTDGRHLQATVASSVERLLIERLRATPRGVLWRRARRRLGRRPNVHSVAPTHWALEGYVGVPHWGYGRDPLDAAASLVSVDVGADWTGERSSPACTTASLDEVCDAVLSTASSPVEQQVVLAVVTERIIPEDVDAVAALGIAPDESTPSDTTLPLDSLIDAADLDSARAAARSIFSGLDETERRLLPHLYRSARENAADPAIGISKTTASVRAAALKKKLCAALLAAPDRTLLVTCLLEAQAAWVDSVGQSGVDEP